MPEPLPTNVETWLIDPLKAPEFSVPDQTGRQVTLQSLRGKPVLLFFWAAAAQLSVDLLKLLNQHRTELSVDDLVVVAVNVDQPDALQRARLLVAQERGSFRVVFATDELAGT